MLDSPYRAPEQDFHLRSQHPCQAHPARRGAARKEVRAKDTDRDRVRNDSGGRRAITRPRQAASSSASAFAPGLLLIGLGLGVMLAPSVNLVQSALPRKAGKISAYHAASPTSAHPSERDRQHDSRLKPPLRKRRLRRHDDLPRHRHHRLSIATRLPANPLQPMSHHSDPRRAQGSRLTDDALRIRCRFRPVMDGVSPRAGAGQRRRDPLVQERSALQIRRGRLRRYIDEPSRSVFLRVDFVSRACRIRAERGAPRPGGSEIGDAGAQPGSCRMCSALSRPFRLAACDRCVWARGVTVHVCASSASAASGIGNLSYGGGQCCIRAPRTWCSGPRPVRDPASPSGW